MAYHAKRRDQTEDSPNEDCATPANEMVDRIGQPTCEQEDGNIGARVDEANDPGILVTYARITRNQTVISSVRYTKLLRKGQVCTVSTGLPSVSLSPYKIHFSYLIPALNGSCNGVQNDSEIQCPGLVPSVCHFSSEKLSIRLFEFRDMFNRGWRLRNQSALYEQLSDVSQVVLVCEMIDILNQLIFRNASQRVLDSGLVRETDSYLTYTYSPEVFSVIAAMLAWRRLSSAMMMELLRSPGAAILLIVQSDYT